MNMPGEKVLFFHMNQLGDLLFTLPFLAAAREQWPDKKIYSFVYGEYAGLLQATGFIDRVFVKPKKNIAKKLALLYHLRKEKIQQAVLFSESPESVLYSVLSGIPRRRGFETASLSLLLTDRVMRQGVPSLYNNLVLGRSIGLHTIPSHYAGLVRIPETVSNAVDKWLSDEKIESARVIVIAPGASARRQDKCWDAENWRSLIDMIANKGYCPVLIGAPREYAALKELSKIAKIFSAYNDILYTAAFLAKVKLFIGIDSGAMHLAAAMRTKVIGLFGPTDPAQVGPQPLKDHSIIKKDAMNKISAEEVWRTVSSHL